MAPQALLVTLRIGSLPNQCRSFREEETLGNAEKPRLSSFTFKDETLNVRVIMMSEWLCMMIESPILHHALVSKCYSSMNWS